VKPGQSRLGLTRRADAAASENREGVDLRLNRRLRHGHLQFGLHRVRKAGERQPRRDGQQPTLLLVLDR
jgi:hypothetical protein